MGAILAGTLAFGLYFLYDINSVLWKKKLPSLFFAAGSILLLVATVWYLAQQLLDGQARLFRNAFWYLYPAAALLGFALMLYSLFFALPFSDTYVHPQEKPAVFDRDVYALCRHPGVLWFGLLYLGLGLAWGTWSALLTGLYFTGLNIGYIVLQDRWTFPHTFAGYETYREHTPFLIPTCASVRRAWQTRTHR